MPISQILGRSLIDLIGKRTTPTQINDIVLDATMAINHQYTNEISQYPVEEGSDITDNIRQLPEQLTITGHFANNPIRILNGQLPDEFTFNQTSRLITAHNILLGYAGYTIPAQPGSSPVRSSNFEPIDIITGLRVYSNMVITSLVFPERRGELEFTMILKPLITVTSDTAIVNNADDVTGTTPNIKNQAQKVVKNGKSKSNETLLSKAIPEGSFIDKKLQPLGRFIRGQ